LGPLLRAVPHHRRNDPHPVLPHTQRPSGAGDAGAPTPECGCRTECGFPGWVRGWCWGYHPSPAAAPAFGSVRQPPPRRAGRGCGAVAAPASRTSAPRLWWLPIRKATLKRRQAHNLAPLGGEAVDALTRRQAPRRVRGTESVTPDTSSSLQLLCVRRRKTSSWVVGRAGDDPTRARRPMSMDICTLTCVRSQEGFSRPV
jgi:hypothetical protein